LHILSFHYGICYNISLLFLQYQIFSQELTCGPKNTVVLKVAFPPWDSDKITF
jgi:hypothetical protein